MYQSKCNFVEGEEVDLDLVLNVMNSGDQYNVNGLINYCEKTVLKEGWVNELSCVEFLKVANTLKLDLLQSNCISFIKKNKNSLSEQVLSSIPPKLLGLLI